MQTIHVHIEQRQEAEECGFQFQVCHQSTPLSMGELWWLTPHLGLDLVICRMGMLSRATNCRCLLGLSGFWGFGCLSRANLGTGGCSLGCVLSNTNTKAGRAGAWAHCHQGRSLW